MRSATLASEIERIQARLTIVADANRCYLPVEERRIIASILALFPEDFAEHLEGPCSGPGDVPVPKIVDLENGHVTFDLRQAEKQPDWKS